MCVCLCACVCLGVCVCFFVGDCMIGQLFGRENKSVSEANRRSDPVNCERTRRPLPPFLLFLLLRPRRRLGSERGKGGSTEWQHSSSYIITTDKSSEARNTHRHTQTTKHTHT